MDKLELGDVVTFKESGEIGLVTLVEPANDACIYQWEITANILWFSDNGTSQEDANDPDGIAVIARASGV